MEGNDVDVTLAQNEIGPLGLFRQIDAVEVPAFAVDDGFGSVHILGLGLVQHPAAEGHHVPFHINDGEHEAAAELIIEPPLLVLHHQPRRQEVSLGIALLLHGGEQAVPAVQRGPQAEIHSGFPGNLPPLQVGGSRRSLGPGKILVEPACGVLVQCQHPLAAA